MPLGYPLVVVVGSKGGAGVTTLTAGLLRVAQEAKQEIAGVDLTVTNDMSRVLGERAISISSLIRHRGRMPSLIDRALRRRTALLGLDLEATMYTDRLAEMLRLLVARRPVIVDAGNAFATTGARPLAPYLSLATHIVLALIPDVRSIARAERLLETWAEHRDKIVPVENMCGESPSIAGTTPVPLAASGSLARLMKEPAGDAIRALAEAMLPQEKVGGTSAEEAAPERGIIRSLLAGHPSAGR
jgi:hypothetical protein